MTHLPYIVASYGLAAIMALVLSLGAALRLKRDRARLAALEQTHNRNAGTPLTPRPARPVASGLSLPVLPALAPRPP